MRVAVDIGPLSSGHKVRGIGFYVKSLTEALGKRVEAIDFSRANLAKYDIVHFTSFRPFFLSLPFKKPAKRAILTIYDLIPLIYPEHYPPGIKGKINFWINKFLIRKNVDAIITISETSKKDICRFLDIAPEKVFVTYLAPRSVFRKLEIGNTNPTSLWKLEIGKRYGLPESFALYVGDVNYNKNIPGLIEMCRYAKIPLVMVGKQAAEIENLDLNHPELSHLAGVSFKNVIRLGFVPDEDLVALYNLADVYIQPSLYEGFALPVLEAKACGTWVIATRIQAHVEILESGREYSWEKTAKDTLEVYAKV